MGLGGGSDLRLVAKFVGFSGGLVMQAILDIAWTHVSFLAVKVWLLPSPRLCYI